MVQNQTNEMKKHLNKYKEKGHMQRTTRSSRGSRGGALQRQLVFSFLSVLLCTVTFFRRLVQVLEKTQKKI